MEDVPGLILDIVRANVGANHLHPRIVLRPLPIPEGSRVVQIWESWRGEGTVPVAWAKFIDWRQQTRSFEEIAGCNWGDSFSLTGGDKPQLVSGRTVSAGFFSVLRIQPALGRNFTPDDSRPGATPVAIIGHELWKNRFDADPAIVGRVVPVDFKAYTIVGVLPSSLKMANQAQLFLPKPEEGEPE